MNCQRSGYTQYLAFVELIIMLISLRTVCALKGKMLSFQHLKRTTTHLRTFHNEKEYLITNSNSQQAEILALAALRPKMKILHSDNLPSRHALTDESSLLWAHYNNDLLLDATSLETMYTGRYKLSEKETVEHWNNMIESRIRSYECLESPALLHLNDLQNIDSSYSYAFEKEIAVSVVQKASFMSRTLQHIMLRNEQSEAEESQSAPNNAVKKKDNSPVTIADFAVQAVVVDRLSQLFPQDSFICEESSEIVRNNPLVCEAVLGVLNNATRDNWSKEKLVAALDRRNIVSGSGRKRVWVLDPIDGTKGFLRGEQFCIALALLVEGVPQLSVLGCPNLNLGRILERDDKKVCISAVDPMCTAAPFRTVESVTLAVEPEQQREVVAEINIPNVDTGSVYYAITNQGAFAKKLSMPLGAAFEVGVSTRAAPENALLCEGVERGHGDHILSQQMARILNLPTDFMRIDSQAKYCVVGSGGAEGMLRLPPKGYQERIWDVVAGAHFVTEAGGRVTDLRGQELDFTRGSFMSTDLDGIIITNGYIHSKVLSAVAAAKEIVTEKFELQQEPDNEVVDDEETDNELTDNEIADNEIVDDDVVDNDDRDETPRRWS